MEEYIDSFKTAEPMTDLISRQAAIDAIKRYESAYSYDLNNGLILAMNAVAEVPTIDPVKHGKWIKDDVGVHCSECFCGWDFLTGIPVEVYGFYYCPNCGARMGDDWEEPEINPCRGCDDYDGRGGCKSHGGCGAERSEEC